MTFTDDPSAQPVTLWMRQLQSGEPAAAEPLWQHFCDKLMELARQRLSPKLRRSYDQEDAAVSAFHSLCRVISEGRAADLNDRLNLWRLLVTITERKITERVRYEAREKRDHRRTVSESCFLKLPGESSTGLNALPAADPTPEFATEFADLCVALLDSLPDDTFRDIATLKLKDFTTQEIAHRLGLHQRTVQRKLLIIQNRLQSMMPAATDSH